MPTPKTLADKIRTLSATSRDLIALRDTFTDTEGNPQPAPEPGEPYVICGGKHERRPHPCHTVHCKICQDLVDLTPQGFSIHAHDPDKHPVLCGDCYLNLLHHLAAVKQFLRQ
jgi:hypothetical protein